MTMAVTAEETAEEALTKSRHPEGQPPRNQQLAKSNPDADSSLSATYG
jgi:hypothetical protein